MLDRLTDNLDIWRKRPWSLAATRTTSAPASRGAAGREAMAEETIGFVGICRMGGPMAGRLLDAGCSLCIYDTQAEATRSLVARGARLAKSPAEVASSADIVLMSLPTPDIVKAVTLGPDGIIAGNRASIVIDLSTSGPGAAKLIAEGFKPRNLTLVDAPVSGGIKGAVNGTLAVMVSCPKET